METITGYISHIIYKNPANGYAVFELTSRGQTVTCTGTLSLTDAGENIEAEGEYTEHPTYGRQFKVARFRTVAPADADSMERYLGSGAISGIGEALAARIVRTFGDDTFRIIEDEPERLSEIKGISERKARDIAAQFCEKKDTRDAISFLQQYGISYAMALRIYEVYGAEVYGILRENPYKLAEDVSGIGFRTADEIASKIGILRDSNFRMRSGLLYVLQLSGGEGHCYLPREMLLQQAGELLDVDTDLLSPELENLAVDRKVIVKHDPAENTDRVYARTFYYAELNCASLLHELAAASLAEADLQSRQETFAAQMENVEGALGIVLDDLQRQAVWESISHGVMILTGGPGTGKTTIINAMIRYFLSEGREIALAAPTGRAAKRMSEATGYEAKTIHRLLEMSGGLSGEHETAHFTRNAEYPLEADVIIIDEMSMVDLFLFQALLEAVPQGARLILVGDENQLPSVGAGQVLQDLLASECFPAVCLQTIFRQAAESDIVMNAHRIRMGQELTLDNKSRDFFLLERNDTDVIYKHMVQLVLENMPAYVHAKPYDIQVLTPMRKGKLGVETLNVILQKYLNPPAPDKREYTFGETVFRENDKVMQIKNNYQLEWEVVSDYGIPVDKGMGVFNGDMGIIQTIDPHARTMTVEYDEGRRVTYPFEQLNEIELAYCITIHKSQGSEYPAVILPLLSGPPVLLNRNLLYTAVTRAKQCVTILGSKKLVQDMVANNCPNKRYTSLAARIRECFAAADYL